MFLSRKKNHLVGLDIGSRTIKVAELSEERGGRVLTKFGMIDIQPNIIQEGLVKDADALSESIRELFRAYNIKEKYVAISVAGYSVIVKRITLATMAEEDLRSKINYEAEQYIPFDLNDVNLDFQILGPVENNPDQMSVVLVAAKKDMINDYTYLIDTLGLVPAVIDVDCFAIQNIFELNYSDEEGPVVLLDIGASKTSLNVVKKNQSLFMRDIAIGGEQLTNEFINRLDCSFDEAEEVKQSLKSSKLTSGEIMDVINSTITYWCGELKRAVDFYHNTYSQEPIKKIFLSGGSANLKGLASSIKDDLSYPVEIFDPFKAIKVDEETFEQKFLQRIAPQATICMGLAIRRVGDK